MHAKIYISQSSSNKRDTQFATSIIGAVLILATLQKGVVHSARPRVHNGNYFIFFRNYSCHDCTR